jgi:peptidyl-Lys metalloendopeptidase
MDSITAKLYAHESYKKDEKANLIFELTNHSKVPVHILKWNTPLEGLKSDCLNVKKNGRPVSYDGLLIKRGQPQPNDFIMLHPGESISNKIDVSEAYNISKPGQVKVDYKTDSLKYYDEPPTAEFLSAETSRKSFKKTPRIKVQSKQAAFKIAGGTKEKLTKGEQVRQAEAKKAPTSKKKINMAKAIAGLRPCVFNGGTPQRQAIVKAAHQNGYDLTLAVLNSMAKNPDYKLWFGTYAKTRFNKIKANYQKIKSDFETKEFTYDLTGQGCGTGVYAYTYRGATTIWLCSAFWTSPDAGTDSRAGTMVHEHSHASAATDDNAYGQEGPDGCKHLALTNPSKAIKNADSHEYYAKG